jgi:hypothetical protein
MYEQYLLPAAMHCGEVIERMAACEASRSIESSATFVGVGVGVGVGVSVVDVGGVGVGAVAA